MVTQKHDLHTRVSCDSASWWNLISLLVKKKLNATSRRPPLFLYARVSRLLRSVHLGLWYGFTLVLHVAPFWIWCFFGFWTLCSKPLWTKNSISQTQSSFFLGESIWVFISALFCAGWHTHNRSVTVLNLMSMVAITISRYRLQREGGWVPLLLWIVLFDRSHSGSRYRLQREGGWVPLLLWIVLFEEAMGVEWSCWSGIWIGTIIWTKQTVSDFLEHLGLHGVGKGQSFELFLVSDLLCFCSCRYAVHLDSEDIFFRTRQFRGIQSWHVR